MKRRLFSLLLMLALLSALALPAAFAEAGYPVTITIYDAQGNPYEEVFETAPQRVVTTTTSAAELLIRLGLQDSIVGIIRPDNAVPEALAEIFASFYDLGDKKTLSKEVVVAAEPDIVIGRVNNFSDETSIESYAELGILSYTQLAGNAAVSASPEALIQDVRNLGQIFGVQELAERYADEMEARLNTIIEKAAESKPETPLRTLFMVNLKDGVFGVMDGKLQDTVMALLGCEDVADKGQSGLTYENLLAYSPDIIFYIQADRNAASDVTAVADLLDAEVLSTIPAIANQRVMTVKYDNIMDVGPRLFDTIEEMYSFIYGE